MNEDILMQDPVFYRALSEKLSSLKDLTRLNYLSAARSFLTFTGKPFNQTTVDDACDYMEHMLEKGKRDRYRRAQLSMLRSIAAAYDTSAGTDVSGSVFAHVSAESGSDKVTKTDCSDLSAVDSVLGLLKEDGDSGKQLYLIIALALESGVQARDIYGLRCRNVRINAAGQPYLDLPPISPDEKGESWSRQFPLKDGTARLLNELVAAKGTTAPDDLVFTNTLGAPLTSKTLNRMLKTAQDRAGIPEEKRFTLSKLYNRCIMEIRNAGADTVKMQDEFQHTSVWFDRYDSRIKDFGDSVLSFNRITVRYFSD